MTSSIYSVIGLLLVISGASAKVTLKANINLFDNLVLPNNEVKLKVETQSNVDFVATTPQNIPADFVALIQNTIKEEKGNDASNNEIKNVLTPKIDKELPDECVNKVHHNSSSENEPCKEKKSNGVALLLTPFLEEGRVAEAREAAKVKKEMFLNIESYSGFMTVNKTYNSNMFFWYFPVEKKPVNETPWIIWLQGGPGASSMVGLFDEIGPFKVDSNGGLSRNPYSWIQNHSLVFIDNPVGVGFSFTKHKNGYATDMDTYSKHLYSTLKQIVQMFPELKTAPLYVAGESYAGKYVPALAMEIHKHRDTPGGDFNFKGIMLGNAYVDPEVIANMVWSFYYFGLIVKEQITSIKPLLDSFVDDIKEKRSIEAKIKWNILVSVIIRLTNQRHIYNYLRDDMNVGKFSRYLNKDEVKSALHVGDRYYTYLNFTVNQALNRDFLSTTRPHIETLLEHYKVLSYCGQLDQAVPCAFISENYRKFKWSGSQEFLNATRHPYIFNTKLCGYHKTGGHLTEVLFRGAGHMVPVDVPAPAQHLIAHFTHDLPLSKKDYLENGLIDQMVIPPRWSHFNLVKF